MSEEWRPVVGTPSYEVSSLGRVRRAARGKSTTVGRVLSSKCRKDGYIPVVLSLGARGANRQALVHHLVAEAFIGPRPSAAHEVAHNDGNPANNTADNLRWATHAENMGDMIPHGRTTAGEKTGWAVLTREQVVALREAKAAKPYGGVAELARKWGLNLATASDAARGATWKHIGEWSNGV